MSTLFLLLLSAFVSPKYKMIKSILFVFLGFILVIIAAFRGPGLDRDYLNYVGMFNDYETENLEPAFFLISKFIHSIGGTPILLFAFFATIGVALKMFAIKQLTELYFFSLIIYFTNFYMLHEMTQIRVGVACGFLLLCIRPIYKRNFKIFFLYAMLGISFHFTALLIFPLWFAFYKVPKKWMALAIPFGYLVFFLGINFITVVPIPGIQDKIELYQQFQEMGYVEREIVNVFSLLFLIRIFVYYILLWKYDLITHNNKYTPLLMNIYLAGLICYLIFANMPVFAIRISELFMIVEIILIPSLIYIFRPFIVGKFLTVIVGMGVFFMFLFYTKLFTI